MVEGLVESLFWIIPLPKERCGVLKLTEIIKKSF